MLRACARRQKALFLMLLCLTLLACSLQSAGPGGGQEQAPAPSPTTSSAGLATEPAVVPPAQAPAESATSTAIPTIGPPPVVTVSASGGRLNVRRGPGPEYDTVGAFLNGQSTNATARNADGSWVLINTPNTSKTLGWITVKTQYTSVNGTVAELPVMVVEAALPANIRNCTPHEMLVNPGGAILLERSSAPENQLQFFPGDYTVTDQTTESSVGNVTVYEGRTIDIKKDGSGKSYTCQ